VIFDSLKFGFMKSCHEFRPWRLLPRPLYAAAKQEGGQRMELSTIGIVGAAPRWATACAHGYWLWQAMDVL